MKAELPAVGEGGRSFSRELSKRRNATGGSGVQRRRRGAATGTSSEEVASGCRGGRVMRAEGGAVREILRMLLKGGDARRSPMQGGTSGKEARCRWCRKKPVQRELFWHAQ
ncbi:unnamed protein product [Victoria cruziana]